MKIQDAALEDVHPARPAYGVTRCFGCASASKPARFERRSIRTQTRASAIVAAGVNRNDFALVYTSLRKQNRHMNCDSYVIGIDPAGWDYQLSIEEPRYRQLIDAQKHLRAALSIERLYDAIFPAYEEWEDALQHIAKHKWDQLNANLLDTLDSMNYLMRRLVPLLSLSKQYEDQTIKHHLPAITSERYDNKTNPSIFYTTRSENLKLCLAYEIRNILQHEETIPNRVRYHRNESQEQYTVDIKIEKSLFDENNKMISQCKKILSAEGDCLSVNELTREYIFHLPEIHTQIRSSIKKKIELDRKLMIEAKSDYEKQSHSSSDRLYLYCISAENVVTDRKALSLDLEWDDVRLALQSRDNDRSKLIERYTLKRRQ